MCAYICYLLSCAYICVFVNLLNAQARNATLLMLGCLVTISRTFTHKTNATHFDKSIVV